MVILSSIYVLFSSTAHAGWWGDWCERHLIADDPYQFEQVSDEWIVDEIERLEMREGQLDARETRYLGLLRAELEARQ